MTSTCNLLFASVALSTGHLFNSFTFFGIIEGFSSSAFFLRRSDRRARTRGLSSLMRRYL